MLSAKIKLMEKGKIEILDKEISSDISKVFNKHQICILEILKEQFIDEFADSDYINQKNIHDFFDSRLKKLKESK